MTGHAFVVQADLTSLVCDEVLVPTDRWLDVGRHWDALHPLEDPTALPVGWSDERVRVTGLLPPVDGLPARRMVNSGGTWTNDVAWLLTGIDEALQAATRGLLERGSNARARPLLALPALGTGAGGYADRRGQVLDGLLTRCRDVAAESGVDIAVVCRARADFTAVQARRAALPGRPVRPLAHRLGRLARDGQLALFLGAGVSVGAGLPGWAELLRRVAASDDRTAALPESWRDGQDLWEAASQLRQRLGDDGLQAAVDEQLSQTRYALSHALLAGLPGREAVTTNFDRLYEQARRVRPLPTFEVLPYVRGTESYLLKLHGDARLRDVVLDGETLRTYDEQRRPLAGLLQGLLLTRHVLFVGCSMQDENVLRNVEEVAALVRQHDHGGSVGTILTLQPDECLAEEWSRRGFSVEASSPAGTPDLEAARDLEVLLDEVLLEATHDEGAHLLDAKYEGILTDGADVARQLRALADSLPPTAEWAGLRRAFLAHGAAISSD